MEPYQAIQNRTAETTAVLKQFMPTLSVGGVTLAALSELSQALSALALARDKAIAASDAADNAENQAYLRLLALCMLLPKVLENELHHAIPAEAELLDHLGTVYAVAPTRSETAIERGQKLLVVLNLANTYFASLTPARPAITSAGRGVDQLAAALTAQRTLLQAVEDRAAEAKVARAALHSAASELDQVNKRFYSRLKAEAREDRELAAALGQITTESNGMPAILAIRSVIQGGIDNRQLLLSYQRSAFPAGTTHSVEWMIEGSDASFAHSVAADPSGNALGPFSAGQTVKLRTRVKNSNGTITGSVRTLAIA